MHGVLCLFLRVNPKKVTFASYRSNTIEGNLHYLYLKFKELHPDYHFHFLFKKFDGSNMGKVKYVFHMLKACVNLANSAFFIIDDFYFPVYVIKPRERTKIVQLWHASGALKKFGHSTVGKPFGPSPFYLKRVPIHANYSMVFVSCREVIPYYAEAFNMPKDRIIPLGIPRTDALLSETFRQRTKRKFVDHFPESRNKKILLYAPTYRGNSHYQDTFKIPLDIDLMERHLGDRYILLVHLHPYMRQEVTVNRDSAFCIHIHEEFDIQELLVIADLLITDYSTVMFDYSLLERPMAFIATDLEEYIHERDFYYDFKSLIPGPLFKETQDLIDWVNREDFDLVKIKKFKHRFFDDIDGRAAERIVKFLTG